MDLALGRHAIRLFAAAVLLAGCAGLGTVPQSIGVAANVDGAARRSILIYASGLYGGVYIYDYFSGKQVGKLKGPGGPMCVDAEGDVFIAQNNGTTLEYAHGGTKILNTYTPGATSIGCSVDAKNNLAVTATSGVVTVYVGGDPSKSKTYSSPSCTDMFGMGYDDQGNLIGLNDSNLPVSVCGVLAGSKKEKTLSMKGFTVNVPGHTMWDGKYIALTDQAFLDKHTYDDGIVEASLSGSKLTSHGEPILTDNCTKGGGTDIVSPFILGDKNTPVNRKQGKVIVAVNPVCTGAGIYEIEFWHYPRGGNPYKVYKVKVELGGVGAVSIGN